MFEMMAAHYEVAHTFGISGWYFCSLFSSYMKCLWTRAIFFIFVRLCFGTGSTLHTGLCTMILNWKMICLGFDFYVPLNRFITCNTWRESLYITFQFHLLWFCRLYWLAANLSWVYQRCQFLHFQWIYCTTVWHNYALRPKHEAY